MEIKVFKMRTLVQVNNKIVKNYMKDKSIIFDNVGENVGGGGNIFCDSLPLNWWGGGAEEF